MNFTSIGNLTVAAIIATNDISAEVTSPVYDEIFYQQMSEAPRLNDSIRVMSYNIRVDHGEDSHCENKWEHRKEKVESLINRYAPDVLALQEPNLMQLEDLQRAFGNEYAFTYFVVNPAAYDTPAEFPSEQSRETQAILYKKERFIDKKISNLGFWLSENPDVFSQIPSWDGSKYIRGANYVTLEDKITGKKFTVLNAHFDHQGLEARIASARLMIAKAYEIAPNDPVILVGDFNTFPGDSKVYNAFAESSLEFADVRDLAEKHYGIEASWVGWEYNNFNEKKLEQTNPGEPARFDQFFVKRGLVVVKWTGIPDDRFKMVWDGKLKEVYPSDHRPILAELLL